MKISKRMACICGMLVGSMAFCDDGPAKAKQEKKPKNPNFTISKETTYVLGPVMADGYIDYVAAINNLAKEGVTPDNNAMIPLLQVFGPKPQMATLPESFFKELGCEKPPENGKYFMDLDQYVKQINHNINNDDLFELTYRLKKEPWSSNEYAFVVKWLEHNAEALSKLKPALEKQRYYSPILRTAKSSNSYQGLMTRWEPFAYQNSNLGKAILIRAMNHLNEKRFTEFEEDVFLVHRFASRISDSLSSFDRYDSLALETYALETSWRLLGKEDVPVDLLKRYFKNLQQIGTTRPYSECLDKGERLDLLDTLLLVDRDGLKVLEQLAGAGGKEPTWQEKVAAGWIKDMSLDPGLKDANVWIDRVVAAVKKDDKKELENIDQEILNLRLNFVKKPGSIFSSEKENRSKPIMDMIKVLVTPVRIKAYYAHKRVEVYRHLTHLAFALEIHKREKQHYPENLAGLAPLYLQTIPTVFFSDSDFRYEKTAKGFRLYSVGRNRKDEQGRGSDDDPAGDDILVEIPFTKHK